MHSGSPTATLAAGSWIGSPTPLAITRLLLLLEELRSAPMRHALITLSATPAAITRLPTRACFLVRPQLLTRVWPLPAGRGIPPVHPFP
jgi:hypothetical protein